jgi:3-oxoacyl-[acyl-carrier protein] reductase
MKRVALVTGGARGIGLGISRCLAKDGFDLAICDIRETTSVDKPMAELRGLGAEAVYVRASVADRAGRETMLSQVRERFGRLDVLVNNAGIAPRERKDILEATEESFEEVLNTNLRGPYFLTQSAARWMIEQRTADFGVHPCIVNISSVSATTASPNRGEYCISKAGIVMATALWATRLAEFGILVYEVRPGIIRSDMTAGVKEKYDRLIGSGLLLQARWGEPEDVGRAVAMLARGDLAYSTGQVIMVDGGLSVPRL